MEREGRARGPYVWGKLESERLGNDAGARARTREESAWPTKMTNSSPYLSSIISFSFQPCSTFQCSVSAIPSIASAVPPAVAAKVSKFTCRNSTGSFVSRSRFFALAIALGGTVSTQHGTGISRTPLPSVSTGVPSLTEPLAKFSQAPSRCWSKITAAGRTWEAQDIRTGNPHAVAFVDSLTDPGPLLDPPEHDSETYPDGVNVEFVVREGDRHVAMRVHERGSGEPSRWKSDEELVWEGLRPELVCEIEFDHITGHRIRHGAKFARWRTDKEPHECVLSQLRS